jgi:RHS repeat-associated protein
VTTNYIYDAFGRLAAEYVNGVLSKDYVRMMSGYIPGGSDLVAIENGPGNAGSPCGTCFVMVDDLGSVRVMTDTGGDIISRHDYLPFGEEVLAGGGRPESGLDHFGARYYGSALGRFTSPDWSAVPQPVPYANLRNPQTLNLCQYTRNSPRRFSDRDGHTHQECGSDTVSTDANGTITVTAHCHDVPDWWDLWTNFQNWRRQQIEAQIKREEDVKRRISSQARPNDNLLTDINNIMMGMVPTFGSWDRSAELFESQTAGMSSEQRVEWVQKQIDQMSSEQWSAHHENAEGMQLDKELDVWTGKRGEGIAVDEHGDLWKGPARQLEQGDLSGSTRLNH